MSTTTFPKQVVVLPQAGRGLHEQLRQLGFVNITGMPWCEPVHDDRGIIQAREIQAGHWWFDGRYTFAVIKSDANG